MPRAYYCLKWVGKRLWFKDMGGIGPQFTTQQREAMRFTSQVSAKLNHCWSWPTCIVEVRTYTKWPTPAEKKKERESLTRQWRRTGKKL
jgi:hypothetical protein